MNSRFHRKQCISMANVMPGQILLPAPNGINSKSVPLKSMELLRNLSGLKLSVSPQYLGFLPIAQALIMTLVLEGISYPLIWHLSLLTLGTNNGTGGCNLKVSLMMDFKYTNWCNSVSSTCPFLIINAPKVNSQNHVRFIREMLSVIKREIWDVTNNVTKEIKIRV